MLTDEELPTITFEEAMHRSALVARACCTINRLGQQRGVCSVCNAGGITEGHGANCNLAIADGAVLDMAGNTLAGNRKTASDNNESTLSSLSFPEGVKTMRSTVPLWPLTRRWGYLAVTERHHTSGFYHRWRFCAVDFDCRLAGL